MRNRDELRTATIRMALSAITTESVSGTAARTLTDDEVVKVLGREAKKRREAAEAFDNGGRPDRAERERAELTVLEDYLPRQLDDAALAAAVAEAIAEVGATGPAQLGQVMKVVNPRLAGQADGSRVSAEVRRQLSGG